MGLFDDMGGKFQEVLKKSGEIAQATAKKSGDLLEIGRIKLKMKEERNNIKAECQELGEKIYQKYGAVPREEVPKEFLAFVLSVSEREAAIDNMQVRIDEIREANGDLTEEDLKEFEEEAAAVPSTGVDLRKNAAPAEAQPVEVVNFGVPFEEHAETPEDK